MKQIKAHYDGKQIVLDEDVQLQPNTLVTVLIEDKNFSSSKTDGKKPNLKAIFGEPVDMGIEDLSENLDHYLYGLPKKSTRL